MGPPDGFKDLRATPGVYSSLSELDEFVDAVNAIKTEGIVR